MVVYSDHTIKTLFLLLHLKESVCSYVLQMCWCEACIGYWSDTEPQKLDWVLVTTSRSTVQSQTASTRFFPPKVFYLTANCGQSEPTWLKRANNNDVPRPFDCALDCFHSHARSETLFEKLEAIITHSNTLWLNIIHFSSLLPAAHLCANRKSEKH